MRTHKLAALCLLALAAAPGPVLADDCKFSKDIDMRLGVAGDFTVERDSSGSIVANGIGGDFNVLKDGSGSIRAENVTGSVSLPAD